MKVGDFIKWCIDNGVPMNAPITIDDHHLGKAMYNPMYKVVSLSTNQQDQKMILDMIASCKCSRAVAIRYLEEANWNLPLAAVTYNREHK